MNICWLLDSGWDWNYPYVAWIWFRLSVLDISSFNQNRKVGSKHSTTGSDVYAMLTSLCSVSLRLEVQWWAVLWMHEDVNWKHCNFNENTIWPRVHQNAYNYPQILPVRILIPISVSLSLSSSWSFHFLINSSPKALSTSQEALVPVAISGSKLPKDGLDLW